MRETENIFQFYSRATERIKGIGDGIMVSAQLSFNSIVERHKLLRIDIDKDYETFFQFYSRATKLKSWSITLRGL